ncbi:DNA topoisomerase III [Akkermansiaceae bacterium]|nr:DNA topoisomerase III [Akkermansiaceae bacterium]MDA7684033.1 DNA topoisomerase III [Akkermansiaceae bacterium]MDB4262145.1 DNA topoisomerase III [Akkermansiaceae bacterium]MDB4274157.1 DNA topoisomerase III [Akkermansiaceae bacterium]MDB4381873.1 DNA topoisomerase III [Akkermansiaceae bacterium]
MRKSATVSKILIIAEKPSVATDLSKALAKALGKFEKKGKSRDAQYFENDQAMITSAVGHLVELKMPTGPNGKNLPWKFDVLPAIPQTFELQPIEQTEGRLKHVLKLAKSKAVTEIVNACDAGREGELIFQYIMDIGDIQKPIKRLWMQSMTTNAIQEAWANLRDGKEMSPLADAAKCRSESDWLVGLNSTRALTCFRSRHGGFNITAAGRVQTPTLAILARREKEIQAFESTPYAEVHGTFGVAAGEYESKWIDLNFKKDETNPHSRAERIWDKERAKLITERCQGKTGTVTEQKKPTKQIAPQLYDLTTLQREAPFTAKNTLGLTQALYERHKMVTYPRTDSRYLPEDYLPNVKQVVEELANSSSDLAPWAKDAIKNDRIKFQKRVFDTTKVSDHFAIIPTGRVVKLNEQESKLYDMIVKRFLAVFFPHAEFEVTKRTTTIDHGSEKDSFRTDGKILVTPGWLAVYGRKPGVGAGKDELCVVQEGENAKAVEIEMLEKETNPPARYTESTLLSAMEGAGKLVDDEELREAMSDRGLGTPATRAATIEGLIRQKYITRDGRELIATGNGVRLIDLLEDMDIKALTSPSMTGDWEAKLRSMEQGKLDRATFMAEIARFTEDAVQKARKHYDTAIAKPYPDLKCICPNCGATELKQTDATYECREAECTFRISKYIAGRRITEEEAKTLFSTKLLEERGGFVSRFNRPFEAALELIQVVSKTGKKGKWKTNFVFDSDLETAADLTEDQLLKEVTLTNGKKAKLYETEKAFLVPDLVSKENPDGFRLGKTILQKELSASEVEELFTKGKTPLLNGFVSKRTKRAFSAHLTLDPETAKIGFEFAAKKAAKKGAKRAAKKAPKRD